jgi:diguanylate cyclase (GGDEF)-like protein/PAS domain S-box-containing protein
MNQTQLSARLEAQLEAIEKLKMQPGNEALIAQLCQTYESFQAFSRVQCDLCLIIDENGFYVDIYGDIELLHQSDIIGKHLGDILPVDKLKKVTDMMDEVLKSKEVFTFEFESFSKLPEFNDALTFEFRAVTIEHYLVTDPDKKHVLFQGRNITESKKIQHKLQEKEARLSLAASNNGIGVWDWDLLTKLVVWDDSMFSLYKIAKDIKEDLFEVWKNLIHLDDFERVIDELQIAIAGDSPFDTEYRICHSDGEIIHIKAVAKIFTDENNNPIRMLGTNIDITEIKNTQEKLKLAANVFTYSSQTIMITDAEGKILEVNDSFTQMIGYERHEVLGKKPNILRSGRHSNDFYQAMWEQLLAKGYWRGEIWNCRKNGEIYPGTLTISSVCDESDNVVNYVGLITDMSQVKDHQGQLEYMAYYDSLTDLPNRTLLSDRLTQAMANCQRHGKLLAVGFLDLDGFKQVNDQYGHEIGDQLLVVISRRMKEILRGSDTLARLGGDEFVAVFTDLNQITECEVILNRLLNFVSRPVILSGSNIVLQISASIGVVIYPQDDADADLLIRHADQAMYLAKQEGKNRYHIFDTQQNRALQSQFDKLQRIRFALNNDEFELFYQPKVNMKTGSIVGVEALIRWFHPENGMIPPNDFLPAIENHPLSLELDEWVINRALNQIEIWQSSGLEIPVSVNISAHQLQQNNFTERLQSLLESHPKVRPNLLELEVLETIGMSDVNNASEIMNACMKLGVSFALDDFGTGYSSLTYLRRLPANLVKIDQSFVRDMLEDPDDLAIVESIIALAKSFKREVIAEGVESIEHGVALLELGCVLAQGYGIARPMPAKALSEWTTTWRSDASWCDVAVH